MPDSIWTFIAIGWLVEAFGLGFVMGRRGFDAFAWTLMAMIMGPLTVPAAAYLLWRPPSGSPRLIHAGRMHHGALRVLVGVDGSPESATALDEADRLFGTSAGSVTLVRVIPFDGSGEAEREAETELKTAVSAHVGMEASAVVLRGEPVHALREYAQKHQCDVMVVGTRGAGLSKALMGSVATGLARGAGIPVLLVGCDAQAGLKQAV
jgi:nucleotide-binding universal stress UspA family protein